MASFGYVRRWRDCPYFNCLSVFKCDAVARRLFVPARAENADTVSENSAIVQAATGYLAGVRDIGFARCKWAASSLPTYDRTHVGRSV